MYSSSYTALLGRVRYPPTRLSAHPVHPEPSRQSTHSLSIMESQRTIMTIIIHTALFYPS